MDKCTGCSDCTLHKCTLHSAQVHTTQVHKLHTARCTQVHRLLRTDLKANLSQSWLLTGSLQLSPEHLVCFADECSTKLYNVHVCYRYAWIHTAIVSRCLKIFTFTKIVCNSFDPYPPMSLGERMILVKSSFGLGCNQRNMIWPNCIDRKIWTQWTWGIKLTLVKDSLRFYWNPVSNLSSTISTTGPRKSFHW